MEWKQALQNLESNPPDYCWTKINDALNEDIPEFRRKLYSLSETAPEQSKTVIFNRLSNKKTPVITINRSKAVAAACIAVMLSLTILYSISTPENKPKMGTSLIEAIDSNHSIQFNNLNGYQKEISPKLKSIFTSHSKVNDSIVQHWQLQLANSPYIPSGSNFFDIAEIINLLKENEKEKN